MSVNGSWGRFSIENGTVDGLPACHAGPGANYLKVCRESSGEPPEGAMAIHDGILAVLEGTLPSFSLEYPCHSPGVKRWFIMTATPLGLGGGGAVISHTSITEKKRAEENVRENQARLDLAIRSARMGVWSWDILEDNRYFDHQACRLLGIDPATYTGVPEEFFRAVHPDDHETIRVALHRVLTEDVLYDAAYRAVWSDGSVHYITSRGRLLRDDAGRPKEISGVIWDVTESKQVEQALRESEERFRTIFEQAAVGVA